MLPEKPLSVAEEGVQKYEKKPDALVAVEDAKRPASALRKRVQRSGGH